MSEQTAYQKMDDFTLANYVTHNLMPGQEPYVNELLKRFIEYVETIETMAGIVGTTPEAFKATIAMTDDEEYDYDRLLAVCRKLLKELQ